MGTEIQINLLNKNTEYASNFDQGHLALPPAKKYAVGKSHMLLIQRRLGAYPLTADPSSHLHGRSNRPRSSLWNKPRRRPRHPQRRRQCP